MNLGGKKARLCRVQKLRLGDLVIECPPYPVFRFIELAVRFSPPHAPGDEAGGEEEKEEAEPFGED